ncbi:hypothetical protein L1080_036940 [Rhodococcus sp. MSC1_016]|uniref:hypothetical protein n=1 Tax=Rhodococcus sp. MSC1_016 TaxID=2909266 RepID=UPI00202F2801|nr:hypothetical protein [Rhodococcus sp. MSC1_016]
MTDNSDARDRAAHPPMSRSAVVPSSTDAARIVEILQLLAAFDSTQPAEMTAPFYEHGYWELHLAVRDLLRILGHDPDD